jgi:hypothetical protein
MDTEDGKNMRSHLESRACAGRGLVGGLILLTVGALFLLSNLGILGPELFRTWWPVLLIAIGVARLFGGRRWERLRRPYTDFGPL